MGLSNKDQLGVASGMVFPRMTILVAHHQEFLLSGYGMQPAGYVNLKYFSRSKGHAHF